MTNEELIQLVAAGDEAALTLLCENNRGLIRRLALRTARRFNCIRLTERNAYTGYTKEMLSELEIEGMLALIEYGRSGAYDSACVAFTTFAVPYLNAAMYRYMESSLGTLSLGRRSMAAVRQVHRLFYGERRSIREIAEELNIPVSAAARHLAYSVHFLSVYDLTEPENENDVFDYLAADQDAESPEEAACRSIEIDRMREAFLSLSKKEQDILGKCFGVFGYRKETLSEIAMYHMMKEDAVEKAKNRALKKLREAYPKIQAATRKRGEFR